MAVEEAKTSVLESLFEEYKKDPSSIFDVKEEIEEQGEDPHEIGKHLADQGLVRDQQFQPPKSFFCRISSQGIEEIEPGYFTELGDKVVHDLAEGEDRQNIMDILELEPVQYHRAFDLAKDLEARGLIKEPMYMGSKNEIVVELSVKGKDYYEKNKGDFF